MNHSILNTGLSIFFFFSVLRWSHWFGACQVMPCYLTLYKLTFLPLSRLTWVKSSSSSSQDPVSNTSPCCNMSSAGSDRLVGLLLPEGGSAFWQLLCH